jgi:hypothetical protein
MQKMGSSVQPREGKHKSIAKRIGGSRTGCMAKTEGALIMESHATWPKAPDEIEYKENETPGRVQAYD